MVVPGGVQNGRQGPLVQRVRLEDLPHGAITFGQREDLLIFLQILFSSLSNDFGLRLFTYITSVSICFHLAVYRKLVLKCQYCCVRILFVQCSAVQNNFLHEVKYIN